MSLLDKFAVKQLLKRGAGEFKPVVNVFYDIYGHKQIKARPLTEQEKQQIRSEGLSVLTFRKKEKHFKKMKNGTDYILEKESKIYGYSNGFKNCTFLTIGKPSEDVVKNYMNIVTTKQLPNVLYHPVLQPEDITEEMLNELRIRNIDGVVLYSEDIKTKHITRINKNSLKNTGYKKKFMSVAGKIFAKRLALTALATSGIFVFNEFLKDPLISFFM